MYKLYYIVYIIKYLLFIIYKYINILFNINIYIIHYYKIFYTFVMGSPINSDTPLDR